VMSSAYSPMSGKGAASGGVGGSRASSRGALRPRANPDPTGLRLALGGLVDGPERRHGERERELLRRVSVYSTGARRDNERSTSRAARQWVESGAASRTPAASSTWSVSDDSMRTTGAGPS
jgi:hypothetical protein